MRKLDRFDVKILNALQRNGRIPLRELSELVGLSQTPCHERIKRLEQDNLIKKYRTNINLNLVLKTSLVYVKVTLGSHKAEDFDTFERAILKYPEVLECHALGGGIDYIIKLIMRSNHECKQFIDMLLDQDIGISAYSPHYITKTVKQYAGVTVDQLATE